MKVREVTNMVLDEVAPYYDEIIAQCFYEIDEMEDLTFAEKKAAKNKLVSNLVKGAVGVGGATALYAGRGKIGRGLQTLGLQRGMATAGKGGKTLRRVGEALQASKTRGIGGDISAVGRGISGAGKKVGNTVSEWGKWAGRKMTGKKKQVAAE